MSMRDVVLLKIKGNDDIELCVEYPPEDLVVRLGHFLFELIYLQR